MRITRSFHRFLLRRMSLIGLPVAILSIVSPLSAEAQSRYVLEHVTDLGGKLRFINAAEGFAHTDYTISYTSDSGRTWTPITRNIQYLLGKDNIGITDVEFIDRNTGWMIIYATSPSSFSIDSSYIYATTDGGATWKREHASVVSATTWASQTFQGIRFVDAMNGWVFGLGVIEHTADGGATWTTQLRWSERTIYNDLFMSGYFRNRNEGWIAGYGSFVLHTTDGGINWTTQHVDSASRPDGGMLHPEAYCLVALDFADSLHGCASAPNGSYLYTRDGGLTWKKAVTGYPNDNVAVAMPSRDVIWQVGGNYCDDKGCYSGQSILYSLDGGESWNAVIAMKSETLGADPQFESIVWINDRVGYISNERGDIYRIRDTSSLLAAVDPSPDEGEGLLVYPNPVDDQVTVRFADPAPHISVKIYDAMGRRVFSSDAGLLREMTIPASSLSPGGYMLEVIAGDTIMRRNIVVVR